MVCTGEIITIVPCCNVRENSHFVTPCDAKVDNSGAELANASSGA